jgi:hypothetical protein
MMKDDIAHLHDTRDVPQHRPVQSPISFADTDVARSLLNLFGPLKTLCPDPKFLLLKGFSLSSRALVLVQPVQCLILIHHVSQPGYRAINPRPPLPRSY